MKRQAFIVAFMTALFITVTITLFCFQSAQLAAVHKRVDTLEINIELQQQKFIQPVSRSSSDDRKLWDRLQFQSEQIQELKQKLDAEQQFYRDFFGEAQRRYLREHK